MGLWNKQYWEGRALYHAINCSRWNPEGRVLRMNPPLKEMDRFWTRFRKSLKKMQRERFLKKDGKVFVANVKRSHESFFVMPMRGDLAYSFSRSDIAYAQWVMKNHRDLFLKLKDWNNLELLITMLKRRKIMKPKLTAQLIFAAWLFSAP